MNINNLKQGCIGLWLPPSNTYAMLDNGEYNGGSVTTNNTLIDISGNGNNMSVTNWTSANRINYPYLRSTSSTRINKADYKAVITDYTIIAKRDLITDNVTSYGFGAQYANDNSTIMFENRAKVGGVWRGSVKSLGVVSYVDLQENGWSYQQKDNYNGVQIAYGEQTEIRTGINFSRLRMLWSNIYCVAFWNRKLSQEEILEFERLFDAGELYQIWTGKSIYNYISGIEVNNTLQEVASERNWSKYSVKSTSVSIDTEDNKAELPAHTTYLYNGETLSVDRISSNTVATKGDTVKINSTYTVEHSNDFKRLFPNLDFMLCPKLQGITDQDLESGKWFKNLAGEAYPVTLTNSSKYIYPNERLVKLDARQWITYNVAGVEEGEPLWTTYPYNMLGCVSHRGDSQGNYTVAFIWRRKSYIRIGEEQTYNIWNGVELQQNNQNWNASGMQHFIDATRTNNDQFPDRVTLGMCMNSLFNYYPTDMFNDLEKDYLLVLSYNCVEGSIYPKCQWTIVNLTDNIQGEIHYNCRGQNQRPTNPVNIYFRCPYNNTGSVCLLAAMDRGLNNEEFKTFVEWLKRLYNEELAQ